MSPDKPIPPNRVKAIRLNLGMSQDKLSELSGVTQTTISHAENHRYAMSGRTTLAIARVFQMPVGDLYLRDDPRSESGNDLFSKARADRVSESKGTDERSIFNVSVSLTRGEFLELVSSLASIDRLASILEEGGTPTDSLLVGLRNFVTRTREVIDKLESAQESPAAPSRLQTIDEGLEVVDQRPESPSSNLPARPSIQNERMTMQELDVVDLMEGGKSVDEIAEIMSVQTNTVIRLLNSIGRKNGEPQAIVSPQAPSIPKLRDDWNVVANNTGLTPREIEVLALIYGGLNNEEIADLLHVDIKTVDRHVSHVFDKIDVKNRRELVEAIKSKKLGG